MLAVPLRRLAVALLVTFVASGVVGAVVAAPALAKSATITLQRGGHDVTVAFRTAQSGEGLATLTVSSPDADWGQLGRESADIRMYVDGRYVSDVIAPFDQPIRRPYLLGALAKGDHVLSLHFSDNRSAAAVDTATVDDVQTRVIDARDPGYLVAKYTPVLYGRNLPAYGGRFDNARSDTPLVAWHDWYPAAKKGHRVLQVSQVWSNEDGGTNTPQLMARWGRTTDIEWIYRVELDQEGRRVAGSDTFQAPNHTTTYFHGRYENDHAVLDTCTENNNVCDKINDPMRFSLSAQESLPAGQPREAIMEGNPWTYQVMAAEMKREGKIEPIASPETPLISDQRNYLFMAIKKDTVPAANSAANWVGLSLGVTLRGSSHVYRSDHLGTGGATDWSIQRDDPAATTVELPAGTTAADLTDIVAYRVVNGTTDPGNAVHVTALLRGFFLGTDYLPQPSFVSWTGSVTLTAQSPSATIWTAGA